MKSPQHYSRIFGLLLAAELLLTVIAVVWRFDLAALLLLTAACVTFAFVWGRLAAEKKRLATIAAGLSHRSADADILEHFESIETAQQNAFAFIQSLIADTQVPEHLIKSSGGIGEQLNLLRDKLVSYRAEERQRSWTQDGIAKFSDILKKGKNLKELAALVIAQLVTYVHANQGGLFVEEKDASGNRYVELVGCYAYGKNKLAQRRIPVGQGLIGECMLSHSTIYIKDVPKTYVTITSGLGEATPTNFVILPLKFNDQFYGVVELASFQLLKPHEIAFLERVSESIAAEIATRRTVQDTERLLSESNRLARELQSHEEEMHQQMEELTSTQEEMERKQAELASLLSAIDNTVASIEFDLQGVIIKANSIFASVAGFNERELVNFNYERLLPAGERDKPQQHMMWQNLRAGKFFEGEFRFVSRTGEEVWLSGTFNPIFNSKHEPFKVIMIGHFTTQQKQKHAELSGFVTALKNSIPYAELDENFVCKSGSERFLKLFQLKRMDLKDKRFCSLLASGANEDVVTGHLSAGPQQVIEQALTYTVNGKSVVMRTSFTPVRDQQNKLLKIIVVLNPESASGQVPVAAVA